MSVARSIKLKTITRLQFSPLPFNFVGSREGALGIECTADQTFEFTKRLLGVDRPAEVNEDVCEAFGELSNMIGGNDPSLPKPGIYLFRISNRSRDQSPYPPDLKKLIPFRKSLAGQQGSTTMHRRSSLKTISRYRKKYLSALLKLRKTLISP
jgi:hypothetical protein